MTETEKKPESAAKIPKTRKTKEKPESVKKTAETKKTATAKTPAKDAETAQKTTQAKLPIETAAAKPNGKVASQPAKPALRPSTAEARKAGGAAGRERKKRYYYFKKIAIKREPENFSKLFIFREKENWWKMVGHSAVMFYYDVAKWIGYSCKLVPDSDFDMKSEDGVVNIKDIWLLDEKLTAVKVNLIKSTDDYRVYNIGKKYTLADLEAYKNEKKMEWARVNKIIVPENMLPSLYMMALRRLSSGRLRPRGIYP